MALQQSTPLLQAYIYKHTIVGDYVVKRYVQLYSNCFTTRRKDPTADPDGDVSTYELDRTGRLDPADAASIPRKRRHIRPHGVGSMTALAAIRRKGQAVELVSSVLHQALCARIAVVRGGPVRCKTSWEVFVWDAAVQHSVRAAVQQHVIGDAACQSIHVSGQLEQLTTRHILHGRPLAHGLLSWLLRICFVESA